LPDGQVHDATVTACLLQPLLFSGRRIQVEIDSRQGLRFGQAGADWHGSLHRPGTVNRIIDGDAQGSSSRDIWPGCLEPSRARACFR
jgi:purine nucleosidase